MRFFGSIDAPPRHKGPKFRRTVNRRLLLISAIAVIILLPAVYFWHQYQVSRLSGAFLGRANRFQKDGDLSREADYLQRYLRLHPEDFGVTVQLAKTMEQGAPGMGGKSRACELYLRALTLQPETAHATKSVLDVRAHLAELLFDTRKYQLAQEQARLVLENDQRHVQALRALALAQHAQFYGGKATDLADVRRALERGLAAAPGDIQLASKLASFYRDELASTVPSADADHLMDRLVTLNKSDAEAYLARYYYRQRYEVGSVADRAPDLETALACDPKDVAALTAAAQLARQQANLKQAEQYCERIIAAMPQAGSGYLQLAEIRIELGDHESAHQLLQQAQQQVTDDALPVILALAEVQLAVEDWDGAAKSFDQAESLLNDRRRQLNRPDRISLDNALALLHARWEMGRGQPVLAIGYLKRVAATQSTGAEAQRDTAARAQALLLLARVYDHLQQWDQAALAYEQVAALRTELVDPLISAAVAWTSANQPDAAERCYRQATVMGAKRPEVWLGLAEILLQRELGQPAEARDWSAFQEALAKGEQAGESAGLRLLEAEFQLVRHAPAFPDAQEVAHALELLQAAEQQAWESPELLRRIVFVYERIDGSADAERVASRYQELIPNDAQNAILTAQRHTLHRENQAAQQVLTAALDSADTAERPAIHQALAGLFLGQGQLAEARQQLIEAAEENPTNRQALVGLLELGLRSGNFEGAEQWEAALGQLDQDQTAQSQFYRAYRTLVQATDATDLQEVEALQRRVESTRPAWSSAYLLKGLLYERQQKIGDAIAAYQSAIHLGEPRLVAYQHLIALLHRTQRFAESQQLLDRLQRYVPSSASLSAFAIQSSLQLNQVDEAIQWATLRCQQQPEDAQAWVWLGSLQLVAGHMEEAGKSLRRAGAAAPQDHRIKAALFSYYLRVGESAAARTELEHLVSSPHWSHAQRAVVQAQGEALLGESATASAIYDQALEQSPHDLELHIQAANFYRTHDPARAEQILRRVLQKAPELSEARRMLVVTLARQGRTEQAIAQCIEAARFDPSTQPAILLATLHNYSVQVDDYPQARALLQKALVEHPLDVNLLFATAQSHLFAERTDEAFRLYEQILQQDPTHVATLNNLAVLLLERDALQEANSRIDRAMELAGQSQPHLLDTKAMILLKQGDHSGAVRLLEKAVAQDQPDSLHLLHLAFAHHQLGAADRAHEVFVRVEQGNLEDNLLAASDRHWLHVLREAFTSSDQ